MKRLLGLDSETGEGREVAAGGAQCVEAVPLTGGIGMAGGSGQGAEAVAEAGVEVQPAGERVEVAADAGGERDAYLCPAGVAPVNGRRGIGAGRGRGDRHGGLEGGAVAGPSAQGGQCEDIVTGAVVRHPIEPGELKAAGEDLSGDHGSAMGERPEGKAWVASPVRSASKAD